MALFARLVRGTMLETLQRDYVRGAREGPALPAVVGLHVLRNSLIPVITAAGPLLGFIITGSFVIELIFNIPGIGQYYVTAVSARLLGRDGAHRPALDDRDHGEPRRRHPLRGARPAHPGRAHLMAATPTDIREEGLAEASMGVSGAPIHQSNLWKDAYRRYLRNRGAVVAGAVFVAILLCLVWPIISPYDPNAVDYTQAKLDPSLEHRSARTSSAVISSPARRWGAGSRS